MDDPLPDERLLSDLALGFMRNSIDSPARDFISEVKQANDDG